MAGTVDERKAAWPRDLWLATATAALSLIVRMMTPATIPHWGEIEACAPGGAMILGVLMAQGRSWRDVAAIVVGGTLGTLLWHVLDHAEPRTMLSSILANVAVGGIAYLLLRGRNESGTMFDRVGDIAALVGASTCVALVATPLVILGDPKLAASPPRLWVIWYLSMTLSLLVVTPIVVVLGRVVNGSWSIRTRWPIAAELVLAFGPVTLVSMFVFFGGSLPIMFLILPAVLQAAFRLRLVGASGAVCIVAAISAYATIHGHGPIAAAVADPVERMLLLKLFYACCFLSALPPSAILTERDAREVDVRRHSEGFRTLLEAIGEVIFQLDAAGNWFYLNPAWEALSGRTVADSLGRSWSETISSGSRDLAERMARLLRGEEKEMRRVVRFDSGSETHWVELFVQHMRTLEGRHGALGTLRDVDARVRQEENTAIAKQHAEERARAATVLAATDELTGMANRRAFLRELNREMASSAEFGWPLSVAMFDVDHFKRVNDRHGHVVGDRVLRQIAERAKAAVRGGDLLGRLGGEEFAILMPGATAEDAIVVAERLRAAVEAPPEEGSRIPTVTVSIGIAERENQRAAGTLLAAADAALYRAKDEGRNRVRIAA